MVLEPSACRTQTHKIQLNATGDGMTMQSKLSSAHTCHRVARPEASRFLRVLPTISKSPREGLALPASWTDGIWGRSIWLLSNLFLFQGTEAI